MDRIALFSLSGLPAAQGRARRIQRQVHGEPVRVARRLMRHAALAHPRDLSQLLLSAHALAIWRDPPCEGSGMNPFAAAALSLHAAAAGFDPLLTEVLAGLSSRPKYLYPKFFYDARGSELFDRICELPEYYLTST